MVMVAELSLRADAEEVWRPLQGNHSGIVIVRKDLWIPDRVKQWNPKSELGQYVRSILHLLPIEQAMELFERVSRTLIIESRLYGRLYRNGQLLHDAGLVSQKVITTAGVQALVDAFQGSFTLSNFRYHGLGTGSTAEAIGDTALVTELTTQLNPDNIRATGTLGEGSAANIYQTIGTNVFDAAATLAEHGVFSQAAIPGGTLLDRSLISPTQAVISGDSYQSRYELTASAGG